MTQSGVWNSNKRQQMNSLSDCLKRFRHIAIDTEYPGCLKETPRDVEGEELYSDLKFNVENTKVIQLGITLFNDEGTIGGTWEVNFCDFDERKDLKNVKSLDFLKGNGLDLEKIRDEGVEANEFFEEFGQIIKGKKIVWVTFQGLYDLAYMVKGLTGGGSLPDSAQSFGELGGKLFHEYCDVKLMVGRHRGLNERFGLQKLAKELRIKRLGDAHHAGSDSELTARVYSQMSILLHLQSLEDEQRLEKEKLMMESFYEPQPHEDELMFEPQGSFLSTIHPSFVEHIFVLPVPKLFNPKNCTYACN